MNWRHAKHSLTGQLERHHLNHHRHSFDNEQASDNRQNDFVFDHHANGSQCAAQRQRSRVAHENHGWWCVKPKESESGANQRATKDGQFTGTLDKRNLQIFGNTLKITMEQA